MTTGTPTLRASSSGSPFQSRLLGLILTGAVLAGLIPHAARAQRPVHWAIGSVPKEVQAGSKSSLQLRATIDSGWHIYALTQSRPPIATSIQLGPQQLVASGSVQQPTPLRKFDDAFGIDAEYFEKSVDFKVPFSVVPGTSAGAHELQLAVKYQTCTSQVCLPPQTEKLTAELHVTAAAAIGGSKSPDNTESSGKVANDESASGATIVPAPIQTPVAAAAPAVSAPNVVGTPGSDTSAVSSALSAQTTTPIVLDTGIWTYILFAAAMGALALLTPCVFPMIPITVSYFTKREDQAGGKTPRSRVIRDAAIYGAGIVFAFSGLGLLLALVFGATGVNRFATNPWVNLLVAALFLTFGLDLIGALEIHLPWQFLTRVSKRTESSGVAGLLFMGLAFTVTTFTCTVPFVGTLLVTAATGQWLWPVVGMLVFSSVFALPFVILATFPALITSLPRSGSWMNALKVTLGVIELGAALKFLSNSDLVWQLGLLHRRTVLVIWIALAVVVALYLIGQIRLRNESVSGDRPGVGVGRMLAGGAFIAVALFLATGLFGGQEHVGAFEPFLPPTVYPGEEAVTSASDKSGGAEQGLTWDSNYDHALAQARSTGRPVFIDFTGYTCTNCRWMEAYVFSRADIKRLFRQYTLVRLYTDGEGAEYERNQDMQLKRFGTVALPMYAILHPDGTTTGTFPGLTRQPAKFAAFLESGLRKQGQTLQ